MKKILIATVVAGAVATSGFAAGLATQKGCVACHGANLERKAPPVTPETRVVSEMTKQEIIDSLKGYKDGTYGRATAAIMKGQVARLSDADIEAIAEAYGQ